MSGQTVGGPAILVAAFGFLSLATGIGDFKSPFWATVIYIFTAILLCWALATLVRLPLSWSRRLRAFRLLRFGGRMPLNTAAKLAYEEARAQKTVWATAAEGLNATKTPEGVLDYVATYFGMHVPIWGSRPPSERLEEIPRNIGERGSMENGATRLTFDDNKNTEFVNLQVRARDVREMLKLMGTD